jgi:hypothetical protein
MYRRSITAFVFAFAILISTAMVFAQQRTVMWTPVAIEKRNLYNGAGGTAMKPNLRRVRFIQKETGGNNLKYRIRDASGRIWVAKIADESQPEVAANRLLYGIGYMTEIDYLAPAVTIPGKGRYTNVRLEARPAGIDRDGRWKWNENPFEGTREFKGLRVMMALINNWDLKDDNNSILRTKGEARYIVSDLGSSFGKLPYASAPILNRFGRSVNDPVDFVNSSFIHGVEPNGEVDFYYKAKGKKVLKDITVQDARWIAGLLSRLSKRQIADAFRAANYSDSEIELLAGAIRHRIDQLNALPTNNLEAIRE